MREAADEIETVGELLEAGKMACGDLPSDASGPLRTLLSVIKEKLRAAGLERDEIGTVRELIEAASMACVDLPPTFGNLSANFVPWRVQRISRPPSLPARIRLA